MVCNVTGDHRKSPDDYHHRKLESWTLYHRSLSWSLGLENSRIDHIADPYYQWCARNNHPNCMEVYLGMRRLDVDNQIRQCYEKSDICCHSNFPFWVNLGDEHLNHP